MAKKRKHDSSTAQTASSTITNSSFPSLQKPKINGSHMPVDTSKPTATFVPQGGRTKTVSIALPGSIIANAQTHETKTSLAGTLARALAVFCVDEIIIFDTPIPAANNNNNNNTASAPSPTVYTAQSHPSHFLAHLLTYLETPPYLRRQLFGMHPNLRTAGTLVSLDMPHHVRAGEEESGGFREGVGVQAPQGQKGIGEEGVTEWVEIGLGTPVRVNRGVPVGARVTVRLQEREAWEVVGPRTPVEENGWFWGYTVRRADSLSGVLTEAQCKGGYDVVVGMSERGTGVGAVLEDLSSGDWEHLLIVFGGVSGLEGAVEGDQELKSRGVTGDGVKELFDHWVNVIPGQGSRTVRTEEAVWCGLMALKDGWM